MYPDPNNPNQNPYNAPTYGYPPQPPPRKRSVWRWYWRQHPAVKVAIGCPASLVSAFIAFFLVIVIVVLATPSTWQTHSPAPTHQVAQAHSPAPTPKPTVKPTPTPTPVQVQPTQPPTQPTQPPAPPPAPTCSGTEMGGTCYNTDATGGALVYGTPPGFCGAFSCIGNFTNGTGYIVECGNQEWSHSGGKSGACSRDGGVIAALYSH